MRRAYTTPGDLEAEAWRPASPGDDRQNQALHGHVPSSSSQAPEAARLEAARREGRLRGVDKITQQPVQVPHVGCSVEVLEDFVSNNATDAVMLRQGWKGYIVKINEEGTALINFAGHHDEHQWVWKARLSKLRVQASSSPPSESSGRATPLCYKRGRFKVTSEGRAVEGRPDDENSVDDRSTTSESTSLRDPDDGGGALKGRQDTVVDRVLRQAHKELTERLRTITELVRAQAAQPAAAPLPSSPRASSSTAPAPPATPRGAAAAAAAATPQGPGAPAAPCPAAEPDVYDIDWSSVCHQLAARPAPEAGSDSTFVDDFIRNLSQMQDLAWAWRSSQRDAGAAAAPAPAAAAGPADPDQPAGGPAAAQASSVPRGGGAAAAAAAWHAAAASEGPGPHAACAADAGPPCGGGSAAVAGGAAAAAVEGAPPPQRIVAAGFPVAAGTVPEIPLTPSLGPARVSNPQMVDHAPLCQSSPPSPRQPTLPRTSSYGGEARPQRQPPLESGATKAQQEKLKRVLPRDLLRLFEGAMDLVHADKTDALIDTTLSGGAASSVVSQPSGSSTSQQAQETGISPDVQGYGSPEVYHQWRVAGQAAAAAGKKNAGQ